MKDIISLDTIQIRFWIRVALITLIWLCIIFSAAGCQTQSSGYNDIDTRDLPKLPKLDGYTP